MKATPKHIVFFLVFITILTQFIDLYYPNDLFFYGQLALLGLMLVMLVYKFTIKK